MLLIFESSIWNMFRYREYVSERKEHLFHI